MAPTLEPLAPIPYNRKNIKKIFFSEITIKAQGLVTRRHRKFPFLRHTYDDLKMTALKFTPWLFQLLQTIVTFLE